MVDRQDFKSNNKKARTLIRYSAYVELIFILLPFVVMTIIFFEKGKWNELIYLTEWSVATAVLGGLSIVNSMKLLDAKSQNLPQLRFIASLTFLLIVAPSLTIFTLNLSIDSLSFFMAVIQILLFIISIVLFVVFDTLEERGREIE